MYLNVHCTLVTLLLRTMQYINNRQYSTSMQSTNECSTVYIVNLCHVQLYTNYCTHFQKIIHDSGPRGSVLAQSEVGEGERDFLEAGEPERDLFEAADPDRDRAADPDLAEPDRERAAEGERDFDPERDREPDFDRDFDRDPDFERDLDLDLDLDRDLEPEPDLEPDLDRPDLEDAALPDLDLEPIEKLTLLKTKKRTIFYLAENNKVYRKILIRVRLRR